jgi:hypothetical protein
MRERSLTRHWLGGALVALWACAGGSQHDRGLDAGGDGPQGNAFPCSESCLDNSQCDAGAVCAFGECQAQCVVAADCAEGTFCLDDGKVAACVDKEVPCVQGGCLAPLECASDHRCRNTCTSAAACNVLGTTGRVCAQDDNGIGFCADPEDVSAGKIVASPPPNASTVPVAAPTDASPDVAPVTYAVNDAGPGPLANDETTGIPCTSDAVCRNPNGPGRNVCSNGFTVSFYGAQVQLWATPVCVLPPSPLGNCFPGADSSDIHFCDGPNDPSSPGICIGLDPTDPLVGLCVPKCTFTEDGSPATGCVGHNACGYLTDLLSVSKQAPIGIGYCKSACVTNADCADLQSDYECQSDEGNCTLIASQRTKKIGDSCSTAGTVNDATLGSCLCANGSAGSGFCTTQCVVGGSAGSDAGSVCPAGWVCESGEPNSLDFGTGAPPISITTPTPGLVGNCIPACAAAQVVPDDAASDDSSSPAANADDAAQPDAKGDAGPCPAGSTCTAGTVAGPDCLQ